MPNAKYDLISPMDEVKGIPINSTSSEAWSDFGGGGASSKVSPIVAYQAVPLIYRCVDMRASGVASIPFDLYPLTSDTPVTDKPEYATIVEDMKGLLWLTEAALCIYRRAYWEVARNRMKRNITPVWMLPTTIKPIKNQDSRVVGGGLMGFERKAGSGDNVRYKLEEIVYFHLPSMTDEIEAGVSPVEVALAAAGVLYDIDQFAQMYFKRGVIKATLLVVEGSPQQEEMERLRAWWGRLMKGIRTAFETIAIQQSVKPVVIGSDLKDTQAPELTTQKREDVALAMGVPYTMLFGNAANYATSMSDQLVFYRNVIIPRAEWIAERVNKQPLKQLGIMMEFDPSRMEIMQYAEVQKAQSLQSLVGNQPILLVDEARAMLGYDPLPKDEGATKSGDQQILGYHIDAGIVTKNEARATLGLPPIDDSEDKARQELQGQLAIVKAATDAKLTPEQGIALALGEPLSDLQAEMEAEEETPPPTTPLPGTTPTNELPIPDGDTETPASPLTSESPETIMDSDETVKALLAELRTARYEVERAVDAVEARKHSGVVAVMDGLSVELGGDV